MVDYYEKYTINPDEDWKAIKQKLSTEQKKWLKRQSSANNSKDLAEINSELDLIDEALNIFNPKNEGIRKKYDEELANDKAEEDTNADKIKLSDVATAISEKPLSLSHYREVQVQMANQVKNRIKGKNDQDKASIGKSEDSER